MIYIENLTVEIDGKEILKDLNLTINKGEIHAIMGPNGSGKSTLSKVIAGSKEYLIKNGDIFVENEFEKLSIIDKEPSDRAKLGIFLAFQHPIEIPGLTNFIFLKTAFDEICKFKGVKVTINEFNNMLNNKLEELNLEKSFMNRGLNSDFSGGEKKKNEILQMVILNPKIAFLDEIDSGLDIDSLKIVSETIRKFHSKKNSIVIVTHYNKILEYIQPDFVHVMYKGKIIKSGNKELSQRIEKEGYELIIKEQGC